MPKAIPMIKNGTPIDVCVNIIYMLIGITSLIECKCIPHPIAM